MPHPPFAPLCCPQIGVTPPLGVWDPLGLIGNDATKYRRWQEMEIKQGRFAMAGTLHVILTMVTRRNSAPQLEPRAASRWTAACVRGVLDALATVSPSTTHPSSSLPEPCVAPNLS